MIMESVVKCFDFLCNLYSSSNILSISWDSYGFLELGVVLNLTLVFPLKVLGRLERLILFLPMTLFLILKIISIIIYTCSFLVPRAGVYSIYVFKSPARGINFTLIK